MKVAINESQEMIKRGQTPNIFSGRALNIPKITLRRGINRKVAGSGCASENKLAGPSSSFSNTIYLLLSHEIYCVCECCYCDNSLYQVAVKIKLISVEMTVFLSELCAEAQRGTCKYSHYHISKTVLLFHIGSHAN